MSDRDKSLRSGERQVHEVLNGIEYWHKWRYEQAAQYCKGKTVLDAGCGVGYGSAMISDVAKQVFSIDDSAEAIEFARQKWQAKNIIYECHDFLMMHVFNVDVIIAFEFIEHIEDTDAVFGKFKSFNPSVIIVSVPHIKCPMGANKFHYRHYGMDELIERFFGIGLKPIKAELVYFDNKLTNYVVAGKV
jgi:2-polyprenyl-3-methyl-5-hydroxy-6-metoxy-1,4-benzoquinol methylase